jgi:2-oxoglutarate ferredoxin oxidoreductase subunit delta
MPRVVINENLCKGCELCISVCPRKIIFLSDTFNARSYHFARTDSNRDDQCTGCTACALICPDVAIEIAGDLDMHSSAET